MWPMLENVPRGRLYAKPTGETGAEIYLLSLESERKRGRGKGRGREREKGREGRRHTNNGKEKKIWMLRKREKVSNKLTNKLTKTRDR